MGRGSEKQGPSAGQGRRKARNRYSFDRHFQPRRPWLGVVALILAAIGLPFFVRAADKGIAATDARLHQIQVIGTHNSYHLRPKPELLRAAALVNRDALSWDYSHAPLNVQLDRGVRSFELDMHLTPSGWEVFHVPAIDNQSSCRRFDDALATIRAWSDRHPGHVPISVLMELKDEGTLLDKRIRVPDAASLDDLDRSIRAAFGANRLLTPDDARGSEATLEAAILKHGWPRLADCQGKVFFILHERGSQRQLYLKDHPTLEGRAMFVNSEPGQPYAAAIVMDSPTDRRIANRAKQGYLIRTRADSTGSTPRKDRQETAWASGAHIVSTDFPPGEAHASGYVLQVPGGGPARICPIHEVGSAPIREPIDGPSATGSK